MTTTTKEAAMTVHAEARSHRKPHRLEYRAYYAIIFLAALPVACLKWLSELPEGKAARHCSPIGAARALTATVLPYIFMA
jgi:PufQ cytochrome subunit